MFRTTKMSSRRRRLLSCTAVPRVGATQHTGEAADAPGSALDGAAAARRAGPRPALIGAVLLVLVAMPGLSAQSELRFGSNRTSISFAEGKERTLLSGSAWIRSDSMYIRADEIELYGEDFRYAICRGNISVTDDEQGIYLTAERLFFDRELDVSRAEGNALMEDRKNEIVVKGGFLEHRSEEDLTLIQVGVRILGEDLTTRSEFARYRRDTEILELSGLPVVFYRGDEYRATRITIDLENDEIQLSRGVEGRITADESDEPSDSEDAEAGPDDAPAGANGESPVDQPSPDSQQDEPSDLPTSEAADE